MKIASTLFELRGFLFYIIMEKSISNETLQKVKSLPRIDFLAFNELVIQNRVERLIKFKTPRTIFFDESDQHFYYLNPYHKELHKCGFFIEINKIQ